MSSVAYPMWVQSCKMLGTGIKYEGTVPNPTNILWVLGATQHQQSLAKHFVLMQEQGTYYHAH